MSSVNHISVRLLRRSVALVVLAALVLGAVPAAACADGDDCGMAATAGVPACGGDSCPLAGALRTASPAADASGDPSFACCSGPELDRQEPGLLSTDRPDDLSVAAIEPGAPAVATHPVASPATRTSRDRPPRPDGGGAVALHRLLSIDLC